MQEVADEMAGPAALVDLRHSSERVGQPKASGDDSGQLHRGGGHDEDVVTAP
jgi:hypothetical protein